VAQVAAAMASGGKSAFEASLARERSLRHALALAEAASVAQVRAAFARAHRLRSGIGPALPPAAAAAALAAFVERSAEPKAAAGVTAALADRALYDAALSEVNGGRLYS